MTRNTSYYVRFSDEHPVFGKYDKRKHYENPERDNFHYFMYERYVNDTGKIEFIADSKYISLSRLRIKREVKLYLAKQPLFVSAVTGKWQTCYERKAELFFKR